MRKGQLKITLHGRDLLKKKRDVLVKEFVQETRNLINSRKSLNMDLNKAISMLIIALSIDGQQKIRSTSFVCKRDLNLEVEKKNLWGVKIPQIKKIPVKRKVNERGYSLISTSFRIDEVAASFEEVVEHVVNIAPLEVKLRKLGEEIQKTTRRVNAMEEVLIPSIVKDINFIKEVLTEREREDLYCLKKVKKKKGRH